MLRRTEKATPSGFTLIEVLVVIAVIGLLAAMLFPAFGRARANARRSSCQSHLKQVALGIKQYLQDFDERFPLIVQGQETTPPLYAFNSPPALGWAELIGPYLKNTQIFQCPSEAAPQDTSVGPIQVSAPDAGYTDYFYNKVIGGTAGNASEDPGSPLVPRLEAQLTFPSNIILLTGCGSGGSSNTTSGADPQPPAGTPVAPFGGRHLSGLNFAFADGHVKWLPKTKPIYGRLTPPSASVITFATAP